MNKLKAQLVWIPWLNGNPGKKPSLDGKRYAKWSNRNILLTIRRSGKATKENAGICTGLSNTKVRKTIADGIADGKEHPRNNKK